MKIGIPKEIKPQESRVAVTPAGVKELTTQNHTVFVEENAGLLSSFSNDDYRQSGAIIVSTAAEVYNNSDMIVKVKEPLESEYAYIESRHTVFTYFHFAASQSLTAAMVNSGATCIAYETIQENNQLPLLIPMSEVAGRLATQQGAKYLEKTYGGAGVLLGGVPGTPPAKVLILGGGTAGTQAAWVAAGMGAQVYILDTNLKRLRYLKEVMPPNVSPLHANTLVIETLISQSHLIIGTVLIPGDKAPKLITKPMLKLMQPGTVLIDVAIDQGGCFETSVPTTHNDPIRIIDGIVHYAVTNMPGAVPQTSTLALTNATLPYVVQLARLGWHAACKQNEALRSGLTVVDGKLISSDIARLFQKKYTPLHQILDFESRQV